MPDSNDYIIDLPKISDPRGNLTFFESKNHIPFEIKRSYWIYDVPGGCDRGGHALKNTDEFIIALSGSFNVEIFDGIETKKIHLSRSYRGVLVTKMNWRNISNFSTNSLCLIVSSSKYNEYDYIRDMDTYNEIMRQKNEL